MIDELDENYTKNMTKQVIKAESKNTNKDVNQKSVDVAEAYSPPRMAAMAAELGFNPGFSLDLTTTNDAGEPWDLSDKKMQDAATKLQDDQKPWLLVVSPPCTWFSTLMNLNIAKMDEGREDAHYKQTKEQKEKGLPRMAMDYAETGEKADKSDERKLLCGRER